LSLIAGVEIRIVAPVSPERTRQQPRPAGAAG
jgi:hypothetical protein